MVGLPTPCNIYDELLKVYNTLKQRGILDSFMEVTGKTEPDNKASGLLKDLWSFAPFEDDIAVEYSYAEEIEYSCIN